MNPALSEVLAQYKTVGSADVSQMEMASDTVESGRRGGSRGSDTLHERASLSRSDISRGILSSTSSSTSEGTVAMRARAKARERSGRLKQKAQRLRRDAYNVGFSGKPASDLVGSTPYQMRAFRKGRGRYRASKKVVGGLETIEEKQEEAPPAPIRAVRRLKRRRRRGASAITGSHAHRVLGPARMPGIRQPVMRWLQTRCGPWWRGGSRQSRDTCATSGPTSHPMVVRTS